MSSDAMQNFWNWKQIALLFRRKKFDLSKWKPQFNFFKETVLHQVKTILYQPPDTANYIAMKFLKSSTDKSLNDHIIRLSPLFHYDTNTPEEVIPFVKDLFGLAMGLTKYEEINLLIACFNAWENGHIYDQPIEFKV